MMMMDTKATAVQAAFVVLCMIGSMLPSAEAFMSQFTPTAHSHLPSSSSCAGAISCPSYVAFDSRQFGGRDFAFGLQAKAGDGDGDAGDSPSSQSASSPSSKQKKPNAKGKAKGKRKKSPSKKGGSKSKGEVSSSSSSSDRERKKKELMKSVQTQMKKQRSSANRQGSQQKQRQPNKGAPRQSSQATQEAESNASNTDGNTEAGAKPNSILSSLNPFQAGQNLRKTLDSLTTNLGGLSEETKQKYYIDDRLSSSDGFLSSSSSQERSGSLEKLLERDDYIPEVLVVGATGEVGRRVVRRLLLEGRFRVRVLVRDLYSETLNMLGTGVTYCQGDLSNMESLEYAVTDVDKIVFCAGAPRPDENDFKRNFQTFVQENLRNGEKGDEKSDDDGSISDMEWEQLDYVLDLRSKLAEQVDLVGVGNLVRAYQNVRHADYGTSQAAKRSLFKFSSRPEDFTLFSIDDTSVDDRAFQGGSKASTGADSQSTSTKPVGQNTDYPDDDGNGGDGKYDEYDFYDEYDEYEDVYGDDYDDDDDDSDGDGSRLEKRRDVTSQVQCRWLRNEMGSGVFVGKIPKSESAGGVQGEAAIISSRLRARDDPDNGIDLGSVFAGFVVRAIADGSNFEAFIRTSSYEDDGVEYVCPFSTQTKAFRGTNRSKNKAVTIRLPFDSFVPVLKREMSTTASADGDDGQQRVTAAPFTGSDVRYIGFRYRSAANDFPTELEQRMQGQPKDRGFISFYLAMRHIKVYRQQPEPEFVYLSDARIPKHTKRGMVRHDLQQLLTADELDTASASDEASAVEIISEDLLTSANDRSQRSKAETYFKYRGEEILKNSGLSYTIIRVAGFNELMSGEASTIDLSSAVGDDIAPVSRDEAAQVCVGALMDPNALNKSVYMGKRQKGSVSDENIGAKFATLPKD